ncbi:LynF/TruF/PatF family peptide O-prenyltransferase [Scytonema sp. PCC 10023]|uniref:LynF/TruF/PatF family peptide O-prenyltransferase n=1 Tax=Scytonema sp. PCC 10023 TaxID=1680591 RepID=UPI0039C6B39B
MLAEDYVLIGNNKNLRYIAEHKRVFEVEHLYPLDILETFGQQVHDWGLECSCKIDKDKLYPARFNLFRNQPNSEHYQTVLNFFRSVEARADVKFNYQRLQHFLGNDFDFSRVGQILVGVDLRREFEASRLKFWFLIQNYPQKLATAIALCQPPQELQTLLIDDSVVVGFDFYFNGRSEIEVYPSIRGEKFKQVDVQIKLAKVFSPKALQLLDGCWSLVIGFSQANPEKVLYYRTRDPNNFIPKLRCGAS